MFSLAADSSWQWHRHLCVHGKHDDVLAASCSSCWRDVRSASLLGYSFPCPSLTVVDLWIEGNSAFNLGTGAEVGKGLLEHSVYFPENRSVLCISHFFSCLDFFLKVANQAFYLVVKKQNLAFFLMHFLQQKMLYDWFTQFSVYCTPWHLVGSPYLTDIR